VAFEPEGYQAASVAAVRRTFRIVNQLGLHARAASVLSKLASGFRSEIQIEKDGQKARSTSVIELLLLCGQPGADVTVVATGEDAEQAVAAIGDLIRDRFGEAN
jgi:phosphotransferase system HPr (HPr) family protein